MEMRGRSGDGNTGVFWRGSGRLCELGFRGVGDEERGKFDIMGLALGAGRGRGRGRWGFW